MFRILVRIPVKCFDPGDIANMFLYRHVTDEKYLIPPMSVVSCDIDVSSSTCHNQVLPPEVFLSNEERVMSSPFVITIRNDVNIN